MLKRGRMGIIQEIQDELLSPQCILSETMRKAYIPAVKLGLIELKEWLDLETQGYPNDIEQVPTYRCLQGQCRGFTPFHTWENINFDSHISEEELSKIKYKVSIFEIEKLLQNSNTIEFTIALPYSLIRMYNITNCGQLAVFIGRRKLQNIINSAKSVLMADIAKLDDVGIEGNNSNFTKDEKERVKTMVINQTFNVSGGNVENQVATENSNQIQNNGWDAKQIKCIIQMLQSQQDNLEIDENARNTLKHELLIVTKELERSEPQYSIIKQGLKSIRTIVEGAASGVVSQTILHMFHLLGC